MSRGKKPSPNERRKWLSEYESGDSVDLIAKRANRDVRTVKKWIDRAVKERRFDSVQTDMLRRALTEHQDDLIDIVNDLITALVIPDLDLPIPWKNDIAELGNLNQLTLKIFPDGIIELTLWPEKTIVFTFLKEHLKNDPLWGELSNWKEVYKAHIRARVKLKKRCVDELAEITGCQVVDKPVEGPFMLYYTGLDYVYYRIIKSKLENYKFKPDKDITIDYEIGEVKRGNTLFASAPGNEDKCVAGIFSVIKDVSKSDEAKSLRLTYENLKIATNNTHRILKLIQLSHFIPGECQICRYVST